ncbi:MAG: hypothetical protein ACI9ZV_000367 [Candidatus Azotimanducaceae bacterium]
MAATERIQRFAQVVRELQGQAFPIENFDGLKAELQPVMP